MRAWMKNFLLWPRQDEEMPFQLLRNGRCLSYPFMCLTLTPAFCLKHSSKKLIPFFNQALFLFGIEFKNKNMLIYFDTE